MSDVIKPEDITKEFVLDWINSSVSDSWKGFIAGRLNAAIEAGIVSPPCYFAKMDDGKIVRTHGVPFLFPGKAWGPYEHWKGQTK